MLFVYNDEHTGFLKLDQLLSRLFLSSSFTNRSEFVDVTSEDRRS